MNEKEMLDKEDIFSKVLRAEEELIFLMLELQKPMIIT